MSLDEKVVRLEDSSCHPVLVSLWEEHGGTILEDLFGLVGEDAERVHSRQSKRKQGFGAFLRELSESLSTAMKLDRLPWKGLSLALYHSQTIWCGRPLMMGLPPVSMARKGRGLESPWAGHGW